jgi:hypothetical protein
MATPSLPKGSRRRQYRLAGAPNETIVLVTFLILAAIMIGVGFILLTHHIALPQIT